MYSFCYQWQNYSTILTCLVRRSFYKSTSLDFVEVCCSELTFKEENVCDFFSNEMKLWCLKKPCDLCLLISPEKQFDFYLSVWMSCRFHRIQKASLHLMGWRHQKGEFCNSIYFVVSNDICGSGIIQTATEIKTANAILASFLYDLDLYSKINKFIIYERQMLKPLKAKCFLIITTVSLEI